MAVIEVKEKEIFNKEDIQVKESNERLRTEQRDLDKQAKLIEIGIEKTETLLKRSTSAEIIQVDKSLNTTFQEEVTNREKQLKAFVDSFSLNESLMAKTVTEGIGAFKTFINKTSSSANQSSVQGNGACEAIRSI